MSDYDYYPRPPRGRDTAREGFRWSKVAIIVGLLILAVLLILGLVSTFVGGGLQRLTADWRGGTDAREQTVADGSYRIGAYDQFFNDCAAIQAKERQITVVEASNSPNKDQELTALRASRESLIARYNADAAKEGTRGQFRDSSLPYSIDPAQEATTCAL